MMIVQYHSFHTYLHHSENNDDERQTGEKNKVSIHSILTSNIALVKRMGEIITWRQPHGRRGVKTMRFFTKYIRFFSSPCNLFQIFTITFLSFYSLTHSVTFFISIWNLGCNADDRASTAFKILRVEYVYKIDLWLHDEQSVLFFFSSHEIPRSAPAILSTFLTLLTWINSYPLSQSFLTQWSQGRSHIKDHAVLSSLRSYTQLVQQFTQMRHKERTGDQKVLQ